MGAALSVSGLILHTASSATRWHRRTCWASPAVPAPPPCFPTYRSCPRRWGNSFCPWPRCSSAALATVAIYLLAWKRGTSPLRLVLIGVGVSAMLTAATTFILVFSPLTTTLSAYVWLTGSVYGASWPEPLALGALVVGHLSAAGAAGPSGDGATTG